MSVNFTLTKSSSQKDVSQLHGNKRHVVLLRGLDTIVRVSSIVNEDNIPSFVASIEAVLLYCGNVWLFLFIVILFAFLHKRFMSFSLRYK